jgi:hypothetical protein
MHAHDGSLFDPNEFGWLPSNIDDRTVLNMLRAVQYVEIGTGRSRERRKLSFRELNVEQIGYVYEGLLSFDGYRADTVTVGLIGKQGLEDEVPLRELERLTAECADVPVLATMIADEFKGSGVGSAHALEKKLVPLGGAEKEEARRKLLSVTRGNNSLTERLLPFFRIIRQDLREQPVVIMPGELFVTESPLRKNTGTHLAPTTPLNVWPRRSSRAPRLQMEDRGGNIGANVEIRYLSCGERRNMREAMAPATSTTFPFAGAATPTSIRLTRKGCDRGPKVLVVGASNLWFAQTLSALAVPPSGAGELEAKVEQYWSQVSGLPKTMYAYGRENVAAFRELARWADDEIEAAVQSVRARQESQQDEPAGGYPDLRTAEWNVFAANHLPEPNGDFALHRHPDGVPQPLHGIFADVVQAERLREVRALVGFTGSTPPIPTTPTWSPRRRWRARTRPGYWPARSAARACSCACPNRCFATGNSASRNPRRFPATGTPTRSSARTATPTGSPARSTR